MELRVNLVSGVVILLLSVSTCRTPDAATSATERFYGSSEQSGQTLGESRFANSRVAASLVDLGFFVSDTPTTANGELVPDDVGFNATPGGRGYSGDVAIMRTSDGIALPQMRDVRDLKIVLKIKVVGNMLTTAAPSRLHLRSGYLRPMDVSGCKNIESIEVSDESGLKRPSQFCAFDEIDGQATNADSRIVVIPMTLVSGAGESKTSLSATATWLATATSFRRGFTRTITVSNLTLNQRSAPGRADSKQGQALESREQNIDSATGGDSDTPILKEDLPGRLSLDDAARMKFFFRSASVLGDCRGSPFAAAGKSVGAALLGQDEQADAVTCRGRNLTGDQCCNLRVERIWYARFRFADLVGAGADCAVPVAEEAYVLAFAAECLASVERLVKARIDSGFATPGQSTSEESPSSGLGSSPECLLSKQATTRAASIGDGEFKRDYELMMASTSAVKRSALEACKDILNTNIPGLANRPFTQLGGDSCARGVAATAYRAAYEVRCQQ